MHSTQPPYKRYLPQGKAKMKRSFLVIIVLASELIFNSKSFAQTFPTNYVPLSPQLVNQSYPIPDNSPDVLSSDLIESSRSTRLAGNGQDISVIGYLPLSAFASASQITQLQQYADQDRKGITAALAMTSASMPSAPGRTSWTVNTSEYRGEHALGGSLAHRFDTNIPLALHVGFSISGSTRAVNAGLQGEF